MIRTWIPATLMLLVVLVLAACGGQSAALATSEPAKPTFAPKATEASAEPTAKAGPTAAPEPTAAGGDLILDSHDVGLDKLKSYRVSWRAHWETTEDGKTGQVTWDWRAEYTADPATLLSACQGTGASGKEPGSLEIWKNGGANSLATRVIIDQEGKKTCSSLLNPSEGLATGPFSPAMLGGLSGAKFAGTETVNGIRSRHYTYDEKAANRTDLGKVSGEIWLAADGGYVVNDTVSWEGGAGPFGAPAAAGESGKGA